MEQPDFDEISDAIMSPITIADEDGNKQKWKDAIEAALEGVWEEGVRAGRMAIIERIDRFMKEKERAEAERADLETINHPEGN